MTKSDRELTQKQLKTDPRQDLDRVSKWARAKQVPFVELAI